MKKYLSTLAYILALFNSAVSYGQNISTIVGTGTAGAAGDGGAAVAGQINQPVEICMDGAGNLYIADWNNHRVRKVNTSGVITTIAGTGIVGFSGDGGPATAAQLNHPYGIIADHAGNVYFSDEYNHRIRKITPSGTISTIAGTGVTGYSGDGGPATAAKIWFPLYMGIDATDNIYFADNQNQRIRKITTSGIISTVAGSGIVGYSGDGGPATAASLNYPGDITTDATGNVYFCDGENGCVRKINTSGIISTIAGTGVPGFTGDGGLATAAQLNTAQSLALDNVGNIYFSDINNNRVRKISTTGIISTIAGTGAAGYSGDGGPATAANLHSPRGMWVDPANNIYVADGLNNRIRKISPNNNAPSFTAGAVGYLSICIGETPTSINTLLSVLDLDVSQTLTWSVVTAPLHGTVSASYTASSTGGVVTPTGTTYMPAAGYTGGDMFKVQVYDGIAYDTITINVTISAPPTAGVISGAGSICVGGSAAMTAGITGGIWTTSVPAVSFVSSTGVVTGLAAGLDTVLYIVSNFCGSDTARMPITVLPLPDAGTISGTDSVCVGSSVTLSETATGGAWSHYVAGVSSVGGSGVVTGVASGIDTIVYTVTNSCGSTAATFRVKVLPLANAGMITGVDSVCPGTTVTLYETVTGGVWSTTTSGFTSVSSTGVVSGLYTGIDTIAYSVTNFCGTAKAIRVVKVLSINFCHYLSVDNAVNNQEDCMIYPNPSNGRFNVLISSPTSKEVKLQLTDVAGRKLTEFALRTNTTTELSMDIAPGIYLLNVVSDRGVISTKIIVTPQEP